MSTNLLTKASENIPFFGNLGLHRQILDMIILIKKEKLFRLEAQCYQRDCSL